MKRWWATKKVIHRGEARWIVVVKPSGGIISHGGKQCRPWRFRTWAVANAHMMNLYRPAHPWCIVDGIYIDKKIVPLIKATWALGIKTEFSCQNQPPAKTGGRWVMLKLSYWDAMRWLRIVRHPSCWRDVLDWVLVPSFEDHAAFFIHFRWRQLSGVMATLRAALKQRRSMK